MGLLRVIIDSGGQGQGVIVYNRLYREPQSWPGLSTLRDVCQKIFTWISMASWTECAFQFLKHWYIPSGSETLRLICVSLSGHGIIEV